MKHILFLSALTLTACDTKVERTQPTTPAPTPAPATTSPPPAPNKLKGTSLDKPQPKPRGKADRGKDAPYVNPLNQKPK